LGVLRTLLAISVLVSHLGGLYGWQLVGGAIAVQSFYIVSGFYMAMILEEKYFKRQNALYLFWSNRLLRLYPIYWVILIATIVLFSTSYAFSARSWQLGNYFEYDLSIGSYVYLIFSQLFLVGQEFSMFLGVSDGALFFNLDESTKLTTNNFMFVPPAWTIGLEVMFYFFAPFLVKLKSRTLWLLVVASVILRFFLVSIGLDFSPWDYRFFPTELIFFIVGMLSYRFSNSFNSISITSSYLVWGFLIFFILLYQFIPVLELGKRVALYVSLTISVPIIFNLFKSSKFDRWVGELSYPIYISHMFLIYVMRTYFIEFTSFVLFVPIFILLVICFSILLIKLVSEPIESFRRSRISSIS